MSHSESVPTSRRLRLRGQRRAGGLDGTALDELAECLAADVNDDTYVDAVELALDRSSTEETIETIRRLVDAEYDVRVRELVVEVRR